MSSGRSRIIRTSLKYENVYKRVNNLEDRAKFTAQEQHATNDAAIKNGSNLSGKARAKDNTKRDR